MSYSGSVFATGSPLIDAFSDELARIASRRQAHAAPGDALAGAALLAEHGPELMQDREMLWSSA